MQLTKVSGQQGLAGHIGWFISYIPDGDGDKEPCLFLYAAKHIRRRTFGIALSSAHKYTNDAYLARKCLTIADMIGFGRNYYDAAYISRAINDGIAALCEAEEYQMVRDSRPHIELPAVGEGRLRIEGEDVGTEVVTPSEIEVAPRLTHVSDTDEEASTLH